jgi:hypothetical protein
MSTRFLTAGELAAIDKWYVIDAADHAISNGAVRSDTPGPAPGKHTISYAQHQKNVKDKGGGTTAPRGWDRSQRGRARRNHRMHASHHCRL